MKIKIGNFNFINDDENKLNSYTHLERNLNYFYLDGKEDTLIVENDYEFDKTKFNLPIPEYEKTLLEKYKIIPLYKKMTNLINMFIKDKVNEIFQNKAYSRYELYKNIQFSSLQEANKNQEFKFGYSGNGTLIDFDKNRIEYDGFVFNPYTLKVENLEEKFRDGKFKENIKAMLIAKEIEEGIEPPFVAEILQISKFLEDKKTANLYFKDCNPFKIRAEIYNFLKSQNVEVKIDLNYDEERNFEKENPGKRYKELKLEDLEKITYSKNELNINTDNFKDLKYQIATKEEDLILFRIDELEKENEKDFNKLHYKYEEENPRGSFPYYIKDVLKELTHIDLRNAQRESGNLNGEMESYPDYYSEELEQILEKDDLINKFKEAENLDDLDKIATNFGDKELLGLVEELIEREEEEEEDFI